MGFPKVLKFDIGFNSQKNKIGGEKNVHRQISDGVDGGPIGG